MNSLSLRDPINIGNIRITEENKDIIHYPANDINANFIEIIDMFVLSLDHTILWKTSGRLKVLNISNVNLVNSYKTLHLMKELEILSLINVGQRIFNDFSIVCMSSLNELDVSNNNLNSLDIGLEFNRTISKLNISGNNLNAEYFKDFVEHLYY